MLKILMILAAGFVAGRVAKRISGARNLDPGRSITVVVLTMLLAFGAGIGGNREIMSMLPTLGMQGAVLGFAAMAGSATSCMLLQGRRRGRGTEPVSETKGGMLKMMGGSALTVVAFGVGVVAGRFGLIPAAIDCDEAAEWLLYVLIALVGFGLGSSRRPKIKVGRNDLRMLAVAPVSVLGTVVAAAVAGLLPGEPDVADSITAVSGMGYYSLSSLMIVQLKAGALQLGAIALIGNIVRELLALMLAPVIARTMGSFALVGAAGVTSLDVLLPSVRRSCGEEGVTVALVNGVMLEVSCPLLITAACGL